MTGPQGMGVLIPNIQIGSGGLGGSVDSSYDFIASSIGAMWYSKLGYTTEENPPLWYTYAEALDNSEYVLGYGPYFVEAWSNEYTDMEWPTFDDAILEDARTHLGPYWVTTFWQHSAKPSYDDFIQNTIGCMWFNKLDELSTDPSPAGPVGGTVTTSGGYRYHTFITSDIDKYFWTMDPTPMAVEAWGIGGGGAGSRAGTATDYGGGGGAGRSQFYTGDVSAYALSTLGAGGAAGGGGLQGNNGASTTIADSTGTLLTAAGGCGGGNAAVSSGVGKSGTGSGGGGGASNSVSGAAGVGTDTSGGSGAG